jgi:PAS domain S-box-containing protein
MGQEELGWLRSISDPIALLEGLFAHSPVAYQIYAPDGHSLLVNGAFLELFGSAPPAEYNVLEDEVAAARGQLSILRRAFAGETVETMPTWYDPRELTQVRVTEGRRCAMICSAFPLFDAAGAIAYVVFVFKDVTAELEAQERAEAERDLLRAIIDQSGDGIIVADAGGELTIFNRAAADQHGASGRGLQAARWAELVGLLAIDGQPLRYADFPLERTLVDRTFHEGRWRVCRPDGVTRTICGTAAPITRPDGKGGGAILVTRDETDRLKLEARLDTLGAQLRAIVEYSPAALYLKDLDGRHLWMSPGYERRSGHPPGFYAGKTASEVFSPESAAIMDQNDRRVLETRAPVTAEETVIEPRGIRTYLTAKFPVLDANGAAIAIGGMSADITEMKEAERRLQQSEERFARYFQVSPLPAAIATLDGHILDVNPACERFAGLPRASLVGHNGAEPSLWLRPDDRRRLFERMALDGRLRDYEVTVETPDGRRRHVLLSVEKIDVVEGQSRLLVLLHDVTEHLRLQDELRQSQKMEAVGRLAGGVAHDFNNLLTALSGYNSLLLAALPADDSRRGFAERVSLAAQRASALTHQLLAFSRKQPVAIEDLDLNEVVRATSDMLRRLIGEDVALVCELSPQLERVRADRAQLEQVIVNLVVNARDAMPHGGRITLSTANRRDERGGSVCFAVRDTGVGIDPQAKVRLFEPFYTTKEPGKGTGLGLATVYGIIKQAGGQVRVESEPGRGALFEVLLPRSIESARAAAKAAPVDEPPRGRGTILLVEDDESVREFVGFVLRQQGYDVLEAEHGPRALEIAETHPGEIDLLLSDMVMPHMGGVAVAEALRRARPTVRVLHISGYPGDGVSGGGAALLAKPFSRETLLARVGELIARPAL